MSLLFLKSWIHRSLYSGFISKLESDTICCEVVLAPTLAMTNWNLAKSLQSMNGTQTLSFRFRIPLNMAINYESIMDDGWTVWVTYKYIQERVCPLMRSFKIKILLISTFLIQRLIAFLSCDSCPKCKLEEGTLQVIGCLCPFLMDLTLDSFCITAVDLLTSRVAEVCNNGLIAWLYFLHLSPGIHTLI